MYDRQQYHAFGLYNVHSLSGVTEGGILGMTLLLNYWLDLSPAITGFIMNAACYLVGWKLLAGRLFFIPPLPGLRFPLPMRVRAVPETLAGISGYAADGSHRGSAVHRYRRGTLREGRRSPSGDDALAMSICRVTKSDIRIPYLASDLLVLALSLSYLDLKRIAVSLLTVVLSGQLIGFVQNARVPQAEG